MVYSDIYKTMLGNKAQETFSRLGGSAFCLPPAWGTIKAQSLNMNNL